MPPIQYNIVFEGSGQGVVIDWGNSPGWIAKFQEAISESNRISLIPKGKESALPVVTVPLPEGREYVVLSKVYGRVDPAVNTKQEIRLYCLGSRNGDGESSVVWIYPNGIIEHAPEPTIVPLFWE